MPQEITLSTSFTNLVRRKSRVCCKIDICDEELPDIEAQINNHIQGQHADALEQRELPWLILKARKGGEEASSRAAVSANRQKSPSSSLEHMLAFIYLAYSMTALLYETVPAFEDALIEFLGDLGRYRMPIEDDHIRDREAWTSVSRFWHSKASDKAPTTGRLYHHLAILAPPNALQQLFYFARSLCMPRPPASAWESIRAFFDPIIKPTAQLPKLPHTPFGSIDAAFARAHEILLSSQRREDLKPAADAVPDMLDDQIRVRASSPGDRDRLPKAGNQRGYISALLPRLSSQLLPWLGSALPIYALLGSVSASPIPETGDNDKGTTTTADAPPLDITWAVLALSTLGATAFYSAVHKDFGNFLSLGMAVTNMGYLFEALVFQETDAAPSRMLTCAALLVPEQNQQVPLMGEIYKREMRIVIWLGAGLTDDLPLARRRDEKDRIERIWASEWFQRLWTIQEFFLAQDGRLHCRRRHLRSRAALHVLRQRRGVAAGRHARAAAVPHAELAAGSAES
ncbi:hypothetical protein DL762_008558 [Monosporascus cannonballus]|uniref:Heterokaryon incompatibility domain-containing protein n=1 Tax=Monosporascus cannonballus TaxID=155416 RepID=A0ABY0GZ56_9PEZI|nr:hypothetical protein DL762_008558 [Monosporascus cannonballus]